MDISKELYDHFNHFNKDTLNTYMLAITQLSLRILLGKKKQQAIYVTLPPSRAASLPPTESSSTSNSTTRHHLC